MSTCPEPTFHDLPELVEGLIFATGQDLNTGLEIADL